MSLGDGIGPGSGRRSGWYEPRRDLGPSANCAPIPPSLAPLVGWRAADEHTVEAIETAAVLAEQAVLPFLMDRREPTFVGLSTVEVHFIDEQTFASFRRTRAVRFSRNEGWWRLVRRWAPVRHDGGLDEAMSRVVVEFLTDEFEGLLTARVFTWLRS